MQMEQGYLTFELSRKARFSMWKNHSLLMRHDIDEHEQRAQRFQKQKLRVVSTSRVTSHQTPLNTLFQQYVVHTDISEYKIYIYLSRSHDVVVGRRIVCITNMQVFIARAV